MKNRKIDTIISLSPFVIALLVPIGRYIFGKLINKKEEQASHDKKK